MLAHDCCRFGEAVKVTVPPFVLLLLVIVTVCVSVAEIPVV